MKKRTKKPRPLSSLKRRYDEVLTRCTDLFAKSTAAERRVNELHREMLFWKQKAQALEGAALQTGVMIQDIAALRDRISKVEAYVSLKTAVQP